MRTGGDDGPRGELDVVIDLVRAQKAAVVAVAQRDTGIELLHLEPAFDRILALTSGSQASPEHIAAFREEGMRLARLGAAAHRVVDGYLSLAWAIWEAASRQPGIPHDDFLAFTDRLLRGMDDGAAATFEGFLAHEVELAATNSERRRSLLEELLTASRSAPEDRARLRRRAERHGIDPDDAYRLILVHAYGRTDEAVDTAIEALERAIRVPVSEYRARAIGLSTIIEWRGRMLVIARATWGKESQLRKAFVQELGQDWVAVDSGPVDGIEPLADALATLQQGVGVAASLGRRGWVGDPGYLALESLLLLDDELVGAAIDQELGPLLADPRMADELIETLEVYLGARQNIAEAARRLHLSTRTVAYRLERIETLLGHPLEGDSIARLGAGLLALRLRRLTSGT